MSEGTTQIRLNKVAREFNVGLSTIIEFLAKKGYKIESSPNTKISEEIYNILAKEYQTEKAEKERSKQIGIDISSHETVSVEDTHKTDKESIKDTENDEVIIRTSISVEKPATVKKEKENEEKTVNIGSDAVKPKKESVQEEVISLKTKEQATAKSDIGTTVRPKESKEKTDEKLIKPTVSVKVKEAVEKIEDVIASVNIELIEELPKEPSPEKTTGGVKVVGKIDLDELKKPGKKSKAVAAKEKKEKVAEDIVTAQDITPENPVQVATETTATASGVVDAEKVSVEAETKEQEKTADVDSTKADVMIVETNKESSEITSEDVVPASTGMDKADNFLKTEYQKIRGIKLTGEKIELPPDVKSQPKRPEGSSDGGKKKKRKRIDQRENKAADVKKPAVGPKNEKSVKSKRGGKRSEVVIRKPNEISPEDIQKQISDTLKRLTAPTKSRASKYKKAKRNLASHQQEEQQMLIEQDKSNLKVTEFVTVNDIANMMNVPVGDVVKTCMKLGLVVSINQRLDAENLLIVADEFGFNVSFVSADVQEAIGENDVDNPDDLVPRSPIVTVMGHVDHGKTSLLDHVRKTNVIAGEAGGITQHIGAYEVELENGKKITFLDTPGHEAFTAMRARGAKVTDVAIIVIAADDAVMPQTKEAINHAMAAGVPMVFAINKMDKPGAQPEKIKEELSAMNILVEDWGGKYQCQEISSKQGLNIDLLLEKVLLEAELMELKGNPNKPALGTVIESSLDKGRGYVTKVLIQNGSLQMGDIVLAGYHYGRVKAMYNERNQRITQAGPSAPVLLLGLNGAPQAGDRFNVMSDEKETKAIASKRLQLQREQGLRTQKHITLDEIGRRIAIGDFKELNVIVKGDVDGSVEALSDSLLKLTTPEVQVNVIHKSVGAVTESDVLLASASNAIIIGFQVRPSQGAKKLAEQEQIDIRLYSIIYNAINELQAAIEGMLSPDIEEKITGNLQIREVFRISKVGAVAGCIVLDGKITRSTNIRVIRDGIVVFTGHLAALKRFKDDVKEVLTGYECGLSIQSFNDIKEGDIIEGYEEVEVKRKL